MANMSVCNDTSEAVELCEAHGLYLKPVAKINICAQLPQLKTPGKTISNWEVMEKVKQMIRPEIFLSIKVVKSTMEFVRLEGEIENKSKVSLLTMKLDGKTIKLSGFPEALKVRAAETKVAFPLRHDWDSYFRDAKNMNELRPGERPDTIHLQDLPTRWFSKQSRKDSESSESKLRPSEEILRKVFETFGEVRRVDVPMLDPYRKEIMGLMAKPGMIQTFNYGQDIQFEAYVQYKEYISFMKAMDALRGMKLMYKEDENKAHTATIKVDFDKSKHLSDKMIRKRRLERERLEELENLRQEEARQKKEEEERKKEEERQRILEAEKEKQRRKEERERLKEQRRKERQEKRRQKQIEKKQKEEEERIKQKIAFEERRLLIAQRKLESLRLLSELFEHVKADKLKEELAQREAEIEEQRKQEALAEQRRRLEEEHLKAETTLKKKLQMRQQEQELRAKILRKLMAKKQEEQDKQREELRLKLAGSHRLKSAVVMKNCRSSVAHEDSTSKQDHTPAAREDKEAKNMNKSDDDDVEIMEVDDKKENVSVIEILSSDDDGAPSPKKQKASSTMQRVLQANRLRGWGARSGEKRDNARYRKDNHHHRPRPRPSPDKSGSKQQIQSTSKETDRCCDCDSSNSASDVIPPRRSSFVPSGDRSRHALRPAHVSHPGPARTPSSVVTSHRRGSPTSRFTSLPLSRFRGSSDHFRRNRRDRNFHTFKQPFLKKYNAGHPHRSRSDNPESRPKSRSTLSDLPQKLSKKKDTDGRYMFPLS